MFLDKPSAGGHTAHAAWRMPYRKGRPVQVGPLDAIMVLGCGYRIEYSVARFK